MALDFSKYGTPVGSSDGLDFSSFGTLAENSPEEGETDYSNLLKQGFARDVAGAYEAAKNSMGVVQLGRLLQGQSPFSSGEDAEKTSQAVLRGIGGTETLRSSDFGTNVKEEAIRSVGGPLSYIGAPIKALSLATRAGGSAVTGAFAEGFGTLGEEAEKTIRGGESSGIGRLLGSLVGGATAVPRAAQVSTAKQAIGGTIDMARKAKADPEGFTEALASGETRRFLDMIAKEEGVEDLPAYLRDLNKSGVKITGKELPLLVSMSENPAVRAMVSERVQTNPDFRANAAKAIADVSKGLEARSTKLFGERGQSLPKMKEGDVVSLNKEDLDLAIGAIDNKIQNNLNPLYPRTTREDIGSSIEHLVDLKKAAVKKEMQPMYKTLEEEARAASAAVSSETSQRLSDFILENNYRDIFGRGTPIDKKIMKVVEDGQGLSFDDLNSLKKEINRIQSITTTGTDTSRRLSQLEDVVNEVRAELPGDFNQRLKDIDQQYYQKLGIPFGAAGVKDIDSKKYAELVAPVITNKGSALKQFIDAVGDEGLPVARDAIISDIWHKAGIVKDGEISQNALSSYLKQKKDVIDQIPGLSDELLNIKNADRLLKERKITLDSQAAQAEKKIADNYFIGLDGTPPNWKQLASSVISDRKIFNKVFGKGGDLTQVSPEVRGAVTNSLRREILSNASSSTGGAVAYLTDPNNSFVINNVFGKGYKEKAIEVAKLLDKVDKADVSKIGIKIREQALDPLASKVAGLDIPYLFSQFRDRISSPAQKIARIASRVKGADIKIKRDEQIEKLLLDPASTEMLARVSKQVGPNIDSPVKAKKIVDAMTAILPSSLIIGAQVGQSGLREEEQPKQIPIGSF